MPSWWGLGMTEGRESASGALPTVARLGQKATASWTRVINQRRVPLGSGRAVRIAAALSLCRKPSLAPETPHIAMDNPQQGSLSWRLSSHPITLLCFLGFRIGKTPSQQQSPAATPNPPEANAMFSFHSQSPRLPLRPPLHQKLRPRLHRHNRTSRNGLLLPQKHRG